MLPMYVLIPATILFLAGLLIFNSFPEEISARAFGTVLTMAGFMLAFARAMGAS